MLNVYKVGMAQLNVVKHPGILTTLGLGSCVGVAVFEPRSKIIGLAHIMLPSSQHMNKSTNAAKFADTGIDLLIQEMLGLGVAKSNLIVKLAGGAQMFSFSGKSDIMRIGERNITAAKMRLREHGLQIVSEDTGGTFGRTIELHSDNGRLVIKTIGHGVKEI